jgi:hypothetical protein
MKRAQSKFKKTFAGGGAFDSIASGSPWGSATGAVNGAITGLLSRKSEAPSDTFDSVYQNQFAKSQGTKNTIGGIGSAIASIPTPFTMVAGTAINLASNLFGGDGAKKAAEDAKLRQWNRNLASNDEQSAKTRNSISTFKAPAYGGSVATGRRGLKLGKPSGLRGGMRFKTKFGNSTC